MTHRSIKRAVMTLTHGNIATESQLDQLSPVDAANRDEQSFVHNPPEALAGPSPTQDDLGTAAAREDSRDAELRTDG
jgi:hypothetical protein